MRSILTATVALAALAGCVAPPATPTPVQVPLVAVPGPDKTPAQFAADDAACRGSASAPSQPQPATTGAASGPAYPSLAGGVQPAADSPGVGYLRCMAARNNTVEPIEEPEPPVLYGYHPAYPVYAGYDYGFPVFYGGFYNLGFFAGYGGFYHRGFGGYDRFGYRGLGYRGYGGYGHHGFNGGGFHGGGFPGGGFAHGGPPGGGFRGGFGGGFRGGGGFHGR